MVRPDPARAPERAALEGATVLLEPLDPARHADDLYAASAGADETWLYLPYGPFQSQRDFVDWLMGPVSYFVLSVVGFVLFLKFRDFLTRPAVAWSVRGCS